MSTWQTDPDGSAGVPLYPDGGVRGAYASRYATVNQATVSNVRETLQLDAPVDNPVRITYAAGLFTVPYAGRYDITAQVRWVANTTGLRQLYCLINNVDMSVDQTGASPISTTMNRLAFTTYLNAGDVVGFSVNQSSGIGLTTAASSTVICVGATISYAGA